MKKSLGSKQYATDEEVKTAVMRQLKEVNRFLQDRDTCSHLKAEYCYWELRLLCWEVGMWSTEDQLHFDVWYMFLCRSLFLYFAQSARAVEYTECTSAEG